MFAARGRLGVLALGDLALLIALRGEPARIARGGCHLFGAELRHRLDSAGIDVLAGRLAAAVLWLAAVWFAVGLLACFTASVPGASGRIAARIARVALPRAVYRVAAGAAGVGVLLAPVPALAHGVATSRPGGAATAPAPVWPTDDPVPTPAWPSSPLPRPPAAPHHPSAPQSPEPRRPVATRSQHSVVVRPGDSLWRIAARHLPATASDRRVAKQWPRWFTANRRVIGTDPDHIVVGQVLVPPDAPPTPQESQP